MDKQYKRIQKRTAAKLYNAKKELYIIPHKCNINSIWLTGCEIINNGLPFEQLINNFIYYNCNNELGKYPAYYMEMDA